jgi:hypothetical protein
MDEVILRKTFTMSGDDLKRAFREDAEFRAPRKALLGSLTYMAHADGFVMVQPEQPPGCRPIALSEEEWRALPVNGQ